MRYLGIGVLALMGCACGANTTGPSKNGYSISGVVVDFMTSTRVPGAVVQLADVSVTTGADGTYVVMVPKTGTYSVSVDGANVGVLEVRGFRDRGDLFVNRGTCVARYGTIGDGRTLRPLAGATVDVGGSLVVTGSDGWYRADLGCPVGGTIGFNTAIMYVTHANYLRGQGVLGRGISGVRRLDLNLEPTTPTRR